MLGRDCWGGIACIGHLPGAKTSAIATGITLSQQQYEVARRRIPEEGLEGRCEARLQDCRDLSGDGVFDKITSVGMFEHVGLGNLHTYFACIQRLLNTREYMYGG